MYCDHPVFGTIAAEPLDTTKAERTRFAEMAAKHAAKQERNLAFFQQLIDYELDGIGDQPTLPDHLCREQQRLEWQIKLFRQVNEQPGADYLPSTHTDADGITWDLQQPGATPHSGDVIDDAGIWRPRPAPTHYSTRYDRSVVKRIEAEREHTELVQSHGVNDVRTIAASNRVDAALNAQAWALKNADSPITKEREGIDEYRKTEEGRNARNENRRKVRDQGNRDLSHLTSEEKAAEKRRADRERAAEKRAAKKAAREANTI